MIGRRLMGVGFLFLGLLTIFFFPYVHERHQHPYLVNAGIIIGLLLIGVGAFLLKV